MVKIPAHQTSLKEFYESQETIYLDSTEIFGYAKKYKKNRAHLDSCVLRSLSKNFVLLTSDLAKFEVISNLRKQFKRVKYSSAKKIFEDIKGEFRILETPIETIKLTAEFLEKCIKSKIDLKDGIHLIASADLNIKIVTHDKGPYQNKDLFYKEVYHPKQALKKKFST